MKKNGRTDRYTLGTFVCLNLSFIGFFIYDGINILLQFLKYIADPEEKEKIEDWEVKNAEIMFLVSKIVRHFSYCT